MKWKKLLSGCGELCRLSVSQAMTPATKRKNRQMKNAKKYWTSDEVLAGINERTASERGDYPRYTVIADGEHCECKGKVQLNRIVSCIYSTTPRVFINAGKGVTIDFDQDLAVG